MHLRGAPRRCLKAWTKGPSTPLALPRPERPRPPSAVQVKAEKPIAGTPMNAKARLRPSHAARPASGRHGSTTFSGYSDGPGDTLDDIESQMENIEREVEILDAGAGKVDEVHRVSPTQEGDASERETPVEMAADPAAAAQSVNISKFAGRFGRRGRHVVMPEPPEFVVSQY